MNNEQYLNEVQKALEKDTSRLGDVYQLVKKGKSLPEISKELNISNEQAYSYWTSIFAIEEQKYMNHYCRKALANFFKQGALQRLDSECGTEYTEASEAFQPMLFEKAEDEV